MTNNNNNATDRAGYQAYMQLETVARDGVTRWHSMTDCRPTAIASLAESIYYVGGLWLGALAGKPPPTRYLFTAHDRTYVRIAVVPFHESNNATRSALPDDAVFYEIAYPPSFAEGAMVLATAAQPV